MRDYRVTSTRKKLDRVYKCGFEALRFDLMKTFQRIGKGEMNGYTAAEIVKNTTMVPRGT
jgi:hypothetical protein